MTAGGAADLGDIARQAGRLCMNDQAQAEALGPAERPAASAPPRPAPPAALEKARLENELSHAREHEDGERIAECAR